MAYTFKELKKMKLVQLKEMAAGIEHEAVKGYTQLNKDHLIQALCTALGIDTFEHHEVKGVNKTTIKAQIKELKKERDKAIGAKDRANLKAVRSQIKKLKKTLRKAMV